MTPQILSYYLPEYLKLVEMIVLDGYVPVPVPMNMCLEELLTSDCCCDSLFLLIFHICLVEKRMNVSLVSAE